MREAWKRLFTEEFNTLLVLNVLTALLCLTVVGAGPALLAMNGTLIKILDNRCGLSRVREYGGMLRAKLVPGLLLEVLAGCYGFLLVWCLAVADRLSQGASLLRAVCTFAGFSASLVLYAAVVIAASVRQPFGTTLWNGVLFAFGRLPKVFMSCLSLFAALALCYLTYPISIVPLAVILLSAASALALGFVWKDLRDLVLANASEQ